MLKKTISKILAVAMLVSALGNFSIFSTVNAEETQVSTKDVWIDFENYDSISEVPTDSTGVYYLDSPFTDKNAARQAEAEIVELGGNKVIKLEAVAPSVSGQGLLNYRQFRVNIDEEVSKNKTIVVEYDMMTNDPDTKKIRTELYYTGGSTWSVLSYMAPKWSSINNGAGTTNQFANDPADGVWYHVKHEFDVKTNMHKSIITRKSDGTKIVSANTYKDTITSIKSIGFHCSSVSGATAYYDNIKVDYVYAVPNPAVEIYAGSEKQTDLDAVSADTDSIKVNFNAEMDSATVNNNTVYLINKLTGDKVGTSVSFADGIATLAINADLQKGLTYQLVVKKDAVNPEGIGAAKAVEFTVENEVVEDAKAENVSIDFENYDSISDIPTVSTSAYFLDTVYEDKTVAQAVADIVTIDGNKVIKLESDGSKNYRQFRLNIDKEASKKSKVVVKYDMMTDDADATKLRTELYYTGGAGWSVLTYMASNWKSVNNGAKTGAGDANIPAIGEWYHVEHEFDVRTNKYVTVITKKADGTQIIKADKYNDTVTSVYSFGLHCSSLKGTTAYFDNVELEYSYDEPKVSEASVKLYADGVEQTNKTRVSQLTNSMTVDFGTAMDVDTLVSDNIYVTNKATGAKVTTALEGCTNGVAEFKFAETLVKNATYVLNITDAVKSVDNISVADYTPVEFTVAGDESLPEVNCGEDMTIDFEGLTITDIPTATTGAYYLYKEGTIAQAAIKTVDGNSYIELPSVKNTETNKVEYNQLMVNIDSAAAKEAEVVVEYDVMTEDASSPIRTELYNGLGFSVLFYANGSSGWNSLNGGQGKTKSGVPAAGKWYHVKHTFDIKNQKFSAVYTEKGSQAALHSVNTYSIPDNDNDNTWKANSVDNITQFGLQCKSTPGTTFFDNVSIKYNYDVPTVTADDITLFNTENAVQDNWNNVSLLTKAVTVDFGAVMDTATLTNENVYLENKATGDKVDAVLSYEDGVLTINLTEKLLEKSVYKLVISDAVTNVKGGKVEGYTPLEFTTGESKRTAVLTGVYNGSAKVEEFADIKAGDTLTINVSYANSTSDAQSVNIIIAYYKGNELAKAELVKTENIAASVATMNYKYNHTVADLTDVTKVKIFSWDSLTNMVPLSKSIILD